MKYDVANATKGEKIMEIYKNILFEGISRYDCQRMIDCFHATEKIFEKNTKIAEMNECNQNVGIILSGEVQIVKYDFDGNKTILERLKKNDIFGNLFNFQNFTDDLIEVISETDTVVLIIAYNELTKRCHEACECHSKIVENLLKLMSQKAISLSEHIEVLSQRTIRGKILSYFKILQYRQKSSETFEIPFSMTELSEYLCINRSAMLREMKNMKEENIISVSGKKVTLANEF